MNRLRLLPGALVAFLAVACDQQHLGNPFAKTKKPEGVFVWETEILGAQVVTTEDFRSDGSVYEDAKGITDTPHTTRGTWSIEGDEIRVSINSNASQYAEVYRWEGDDLVAIRHEKDGRAEIISNPPRYRKR